MALYIFVSVLLYGKRNGNKWFGMGCDVPNGINLLMGECAEFIMMADKRAYTYYVYYAYIMHILCIMRMLPV